MLDILNYLRFARNVGRRPLLAGLVCFANGWIGKLLGHPKLSAQWKKGGSTSEESFVCYQVLVSSAAQIFFVSVACAKTDCLLCACVGVDVCTVSCYPWKII